MDRSRRRAARSVSVISTEQWLGLYAPHAWLRKSRLTSLMLNSENGEVLSGCAPQGIAPSEVHLLHASRLRPIVHLQGIEAPPASSGPEPTGS